MKKTQAFVYKWTQLSTGKWYIGSRTSQGCHPGDGYISSSKVITPMILENKNDWQRELLVIGESTYIVEMESKLLGLLDAKNDPMSFNKHNGDGKFTNAGKPSDKKGKPSPNKGKTPWNKGLTKDTDKRVAKSSKSHKNQIPWNKGLTKNMDDRLQQFSDNMVGKPSNRKGKSQKTSSKI